jgi:glyoxylase-like metal-dependent hydrolase (beta-lactamase superfamily II)
MIATPTVQPFFDPATSTFTYVVQDPDSPAAAIIDPVLDYDPRSGQVSTRSADLVARHCRDRALQVSWILETHAHADHLSAAIYLREALGGQVAIGAAIVDVQRTFKRLLAYGAEFAADGSQFDRLLRDGETLPLGGLSIQVIAVPGHTPDSVAFIAGDAVFVGDTIFMPDCGTARCDFPGGDARSLYRSAQRLLAMPDATRLYMCHDYPPAGRDPASVTTPAAQRAANIHLRGGTSEADFVRMRETRDATLAKPVLLWPAIQTNIRAGRLPAPEAGGLRFMRIPLSGATI